MFACFHEFQLTFQTDVKSLTLKSFFVLNHPFRGVHFAVYRFTYGQSWLTKGTWFCISTLLLNHLNVMVHLLVKSTYSIRPKSLFESLSLFSKDQMIFDWWNVRKTPYGFAWTGPYCRPANLKIQNDDAHGIRTFIGLNLVCPGF